MQEAVKAKALELLQSGKADRVLGWKQGDFFYDETPAVFETPEEIESSFVFDLFSAPNLSKYLIQESRKGGVVAVFLKPCDSYSFQQLLKEHRILREHVYVVGVQCNGTSDGERLRMAGCRGVTAVKEEGDGLLLSTLYGEKRLAKKDVLLERCAVCKSHKLVVYDELLGEQGEEVDSARFEEVEKLEAMTPGRPLRVLPGGAEPLHPLQRLQERMSRVQLREVRL